VKIATAVAGEAPTPDVIVVTGLVAADQRSDVTADTQGKVINVLCERGQRVKLHWHPYPEVFVVMDGTAKFTVGDRVRTRNIHPQGHTRLPRYVRGHVGVVERLHGCQVFPDSAAMGQGENPQWLYTVRFDGRDLWGADADPTVVVSVEAFEPYLEAVT